MEKRFWTQSTKDRWFFAALALSAVGVGWVFWPYAYVLLVALVTVVVSWPVHKRMLRYCEGKKALAAFLTTVVMAVLVFGPLSYLIYLFGMEITGAVQIAQQGVDGGAIQSWFDSSSLWVQEWVQEAGEDSLLPVWAVEGISDAVSKEGWLVSQLQETAGTVLARVGGALTNSLPSVFSVLVNFSIDVVIYVFTVVTLYMEGPAMIVALKRLSPLADEYEDRLFAVFGEFSINMVVGSLATAAIQGVVAALGYWIVGVDRVIFLGVATGVLSFVPLVGTLAVWVPVSLYVGVNMGWSWALFVVVWSIVFTGTVDNLARPLFMRGSTDIHPLLVFLSVFGGMYWMGIPGVLVGPVIVAFFLALYTIYLNDYLGVENEKEQAEEGVMVKLKGLWEGIRSRMSAPPSVESEHAPSEKMSEPPNENSSTDLQSSED